MVENRRSHNQLPNSVHKEVDLLEGERVYCSIYLLTALIARSCSMYVDDMADMLKQHTHTMVHQTCVMCKL